jgi:hypothetical protein
LALTEAATGQRLLLGPAAGTSARAAWQHSPVSAWTHAVAPLLSDPMLAVAGVWALAAACLPWFVRGRSAPVDIVLGAAWAGALLSATTWAVHLTGQALGDSPALPAPRGALPAAAAGAIVAVAARALRTARAASSSGHEVALPGARPLLGARTGAPPRRWP